MSKLKKGTGVKKIKKSEILKMKSEIKEKYLAKYEFGSAEYVEREYWFEQYYAAGSYTYVTKLVNLVRTRHLSYEQALTLVKAVKAKLDFAHIKVIARKEYSPSRIELMLEAFKKGATIEQLNQYAIFKKANTLQFKHMLLAAQYGADSKDLAMYLGVKDAAVIFKLTECFKTHVDTKYIQLFADGEFDLGQMSQIILGTKSGLGDDIKYFARTVFDADQMNIIRTSLKVGLDWETQIKHYASPAFEPAQMKALRYGFLSGVSEKDMVRICKPVYNKLQMKVLVSGFVNGLIYTGQMYYVLYPNLNAKQMKELIKGFMQGLKWDKVQIYGKPKMFSWRQMAEIRRAIVHGCSKSEVSILACTYLSGYRMAAYRVAFESAHLAEDYAEAVRGAGGKFVKAATLPTYQPELRSVADTLENQYKNKH